MSVYHFCQSKHRRPYRDQRDMLHRHAQKGRAWHICNRHLEPSALNALECVVKGMSHRESELVNQPSRETIFSANFLLVVGDRNTSCLRKLEQSKRHCNICFLLVTPALSTRDSLSASLLSKFRVCVLAWCVQGPSPGLMAGSDPASQEPGARHRQAQIEFSGPMRIFNRL